MNKNCLLTGMIVSLCLSQACAQVQEMATDRPDQSNTPVLVPQGALQIETGMIIEKDNTGAYECINYAYNNSLLKFGVNENFEARLAIGYLGVKQISDQAVRKGFGPVAVGVKIKLADECNAWPQAALITNVTLKSGADEFKPPFTSTDVVISLSHSPGARFSLTLNAGVKWNGNSPEAVWMYAISTGYNIGAKLGLFVEAYGFFPESHQADHRADGGITYKILPRLQWDVSAGMSITETSKKIFANTGLCVRLFK